MDIGIIRTLVYAFEEQQIDDIFESQEDVIEMINSDSYKESYTPDSLSGLLELLLGIEFSTEEFRPSNIDENDEDFEFEHLFECAEVIEEMEHFESGVFFDVDAVSGTSYSLNTITKDDLKKIRVIFAKMTIIVMKVLFLKRFGILLLS